jgi:lysophospholipase L1-like esterase
MKLRRLLLLTLVLCCCALARAEDPPWLAPMKQVHAKFTGQRGTFAQFGDSITITMAYWAPLRYDHKNLDGSAQKAFDLVNAYMLKDCWDKWKGPDFGNNGSMTIRWADENVDRWLKKLNPEVVLIMFGTNDLNQLKIDEYETKTRTVVKKCLDNGAIVILSTIPPRSGRLDQSRQFTEVIKKIAADTKVPLVDYFGECLKRRPDDWDGTLAKFNDGNKDVYDVPTLISKDGVHPSNPKNFSGDYSDQGLRSNGFVLRNYLTLIAYADVIQKILK